MPPIRIRVQWPGVLITAIVVLATSCQPSASGNPSASPSELPSASPSASASGSAEPTEPPPAALMVRLTSEIHNPPVLGLEVEIMSDGQVVAKPQLAEVPIAWETRGLTPSGMAQIQEAILDAPLLQASGEYQHEWLDPDPMSHPIGMGAIWQAFVIGTGDDAVTVRFTPWGPDDATWFVASPELEELTRLAHELATLDAWITLDGWTTTTWAPYEATSHLFWVTVWPPPAPDGIPSLVGASWPFDGPVEEFGEVIATDFSEGRCGYLESPAANDVLTIISGIGGELGLRVEATTEGGWVGLFLTPRTVDGFPTCGDEAPFLPPYAAIP